MSDSSRGRRPRRLVLCLWLCAGLMVLRSGRSSGASRDAGGASGAPCASFDFAGQLPRAAVEPETRFLDLGTREARASLLSGWSIDERWHDQFSFVWAMGAAATVRFTRFAAGPFALYFRCRPIDIEGAPPQEVAILVNGTRLGVTRLKPDFDTYRMPIPATALRTGENVLELRFAHFRAEPPVPRGVPEPRRLAVAWDWIGFGVKSAPAALPAPQPSAPAGSLALPFLSRVAFDVEVPPGSVLRWRAIRLWRTPRLGPGASLDVEITWDAPENRQLHFEQRAFASPVDVPLTNQKPALARISFLARPGKSAAAETSGLTLELPELLAAGCPSFAGAPAAPGRTRTGH